MGNKKILLVEDDQLMRTLYSDLLVTENYEVHTATNGENAYTAMVSNTYDLILLDYFLPGMNADALLVRLGKEHPEILKRPIVFVTNLDKDQAEERIGKLGYKYLIKSDLTPENFIKRVKELITI